MRGGFPGARRFNQSMNVPSRLAAQVEPMMFPPGSHTFEAPATGNWKFVLWGGGAAAAEPDGGGSGAYIEITKFLRTADAVALVVGNGGTLNNTPSAAGDSTATFPDGTVATAGAASGRTGGVATGGDVNLAGSTGGDGAVGGAGANGAGNGGGLGASGNGSTRAGGAGAPANLPFHGGRGGNFATADYRGRTPAGGSATNGSSAVAGDGMIIAVLARS